MKHRFHKFSRIIMEHGFHRFHGLAQIIRVT